MASKRPRLQARRANSLNLNNTMAAAVIAPVHDKENVHHVQSSSDDTLSKAESVSKPEDVSSREASRRLRSASKYSTMPNAMQL